MNSTDQRINHLAKFKNHHNRFSAIMSPANQQSDFKSNIYFESWVFTGLSK